MSTLGRVSGEVEKTKERKKRGKGREKGGKKGREREKRGHISRTAHRIASKPRDQAFGASARRPRPVFRLEDHLGRWPSPLASSRPRRLSESGGKGRRRSRRWSALSTAQSVGHYRSLLTRARALGRAPDGPPVEKVRAGASLSGGLGLGLAGLGVRVRCSRSSVRTLASSVGVRVSV